METKQCKLIPLDNQVVVRRDDKEEKTPGGIVLPDTAKEKPRRGTVLAVGPGKLLENGQRAAMQVQAGIPIVFGKYAGTEIEQDGETLVVMNESDILAIVGD